MKQTRKKHSWRRRWRSCCDRPRQRMMRKTGGTAMSSVPVPQAGSQMRRAATELGSDQSASCSRKASDASRTAAAVEV